MWYKSFGHKVNMLAADIGILGLVFIKILVPMTIMQRKFLHSK